MILVDHEKVAVTIDFDRAIQNLRGLAVDGAELAVNVAELAVDGALLAVDGAELTINRA
jgi:hypothetical protein